MLHCITCHDRKSQKPSKTATLLEVGGPEILPLELIVVISAPVLDFQPWGWASAQPPELLGKPSQVKLAFFLGE